MNESAQQRVLQFARSMKKWGKSGFEIAAKEEIDKRLDICKNCEFNTNQAVSVGRCLKCGCFLKFKTRLSTEGCPIGKW